MSSLISQALLIGSPLLPGPGLPNADQFWERRVETTLLPGLLWKRLFHLAKLRSTATARRMLSLSSDLRCSCVLVLPLQLPPVPSQPFLHYCQNCKGPNLLSSPALLHACSWQRELAGAPLSAPVYPRAGSGAEQPQHHHQDPAVSPRFSSSSLRLSSVAEQG